MKNKLLNLTENTFIRNVLILSSGTALAQVINMVFSPFITRIYGPEAYGLMGTFSAIVQIVGPVAALSYPIAIVLPEKDNEARDIAKLSLYVTLFNTVIVFLFLLLFGGVVVNIFNMQSISQYILLIPLVILTAGILQILQQWLIRKNQFQISAKANLLETLIINIGKLSIGLFYPEAAILVFFTAIRQGISAFFMYIYSSKLKISNLFSIFKDNNETQTELAKKYKDFPLFRTPEVALSAISSNAPTLLLTSFFGPAAAGFYSIARTVLAVPTALIADSVGNVFYPRVSKVANEKKPIKPLIIKSTFYLFLVGLIPYGIIILFGPWLFSLVFGSDWSIAGEYARWVSLWSFFNFINKPSVKALPVMHAQKFQLIFTIIKLIVTSLGLLIGFYIFDSDQVAIALFSILGAISYALLIVMTIYKSKKYDEVNTDSNNQ